MFLKDFTQLKDRFSDRCIF